jgi:hypothetical protein
LGGRGRGFDLVGFLLEKYDFLRLPSLKDSGFFSKNAANQLESQGIVC